MEYSLTKVVNPRTIFPVTIVLGSTKQRNYDDIAIIVLKTEELNERTLQHSARIFWKGSIQSHKDINVLSRMHKDCIPTK